MIADNLKEIVDELSIFDDALEKYEYIIEIGSQNFDFDESYKSDKYLVSGCSSSVWLYCTKVDDKLFFHSDSNAMIAKGLATIICKVYSGNSSKEILNSDVKLLEKINLSEIITPVRQNGVASMQRYILKFAKDYEDGS